MAKDRPIWHDQKEGRFFTRLEVAGTLRGGAVALPLHVVTGRRDGPTLGMIATVHGDEVLPAMIMRELMQGLDTARLRGRLAVVPVANPLALAAFNRQTPEQHGRTDLHEVFPGGAGGNLTQRVAWTITTHLLDHVDAFVDYHCGGSGGRLQNRADFNEKAPPPVHEKSLELARAFGAPFVHENNLNGTATSYLNPKGIPTVNAETGGSWLAADATDAYRRDGARGLRNVMAALGMLEGEPAPKPPRQLLLRVAGRFEANPRHGGYLVSRFPRPDDLGRRLAKGTLLGEIVDMHTLDVVDEIRAPVDGYLFFSRYSGTIEAGTKAFALAEEATSTWLD